MKTPLIYGLLTALAGALCTLLLFFLGYHSDVAKLQTAQVAGTIAMIVIGVGGMVLGIRARRAETPVTEPFNFGRAFTAGLLVGIFGALFGSVFQTLYITVINPGFTDILLQAQTAKLEAKGMPSDQIEKAMGFMHFLFKPAIQFVFGILGGAFWSVIIALICAPFLRREAVIDPNSQIPAAEQA